MNREATTDYNVHVEILLEEPSMENFLIEMLPKILPSGYKLNENCFLRPHQGKSDLKKSIPKKMKVFSNYQVSAKIIIIQDQDSNDCKKLKQDLLQIATQSEDCPFLIRIACRELENWYLGDMHAIEQVYTAFKAANYKNKSKFRNVDNCHGANELKKLIPDFQKGYASKNISKQMNPQGNVSTSFNQLILGIKKFLT